jgi:hypothetical protein
MAKCFKVWLEFEEYDDETGEEIDRDDLSFMLPFADSATCETEAEAFRTALEMHQAVNPEFEIDEDLIKQVRQAT